jgi:ferredoxin/flavodoxin---NADP+ reductase
MNGRPASSRSLRIGIVGGGPAGLYAATDLLARDTAVSVDMFERLPLPGGLARYGVAPDHAERRQVVDHYGRLAEASGRFRLHGNVEVGRHVSHEELLEHCHAVIYASGAAGDRRLDIPGEDLPGSHSATELVAWYNGHPDFTDRRMRLDCERAVVIGNGNVALDVARMLLTPESKLRETDVTGPVLEALSHSTIREVVILGRRGPAEASFTVPELVELLEQDDFDVMVDCPRELLSDDGHAFHPLRLKLLRECAERGSRGRQRRLVLRFLTSPTEFVGTDRVQGLRVLRNRLFDGPDGSVRIESTSEIETLSAGLVLRSVGYRATPLPSLPFDDARGVVPNCNGRVFDPLLATPLTGVYVAGWLKRGPKGFIGTNKLCSRETVSALLEDAAASRLARPIRSPLELDELLTARQPVQVGYAGWKRIVRAERSRGAALGRPCARLNSWPDLLGAAL